MDVEGILVTRQECRVSFVRLHGYVGLVGATTRGRVGYVGLVGGASPNFTGFFPAQLLADSFFALARCRRRNRKKRVSRLA